MLAAKTYIKSHTRYTNDPDSHISDPSFIDSSTHLFNACTLLLTTTQKRSERHTLLEKYIHASVHLMNEETSIDISTALAKSDVYLLELESVYPGSTRVLLLKGMLLEARGKVSEAIDVYDACIATHEVSLPVRKRRLAALVGRDDDTSVQEIVQHLDVFGGDVESWWMLSQLYSKKGMRKQALFCLEEIVLLRPFNHFWLLKMGDVIVEGGGFLEGMRWYCRVVELCQSCLEAWVGIKRCLLELKSGSEVHGRLEKLCNVRIEKLNK